MTRPIHPREMAGRSEMRPRRRDGVDCSRVIDAFDEEGG